MENISLFDDFKLSALKNFLNLSNYLYENYAEKISNIYFKKELEWIKLVGKERWFSLDQEKREFLIKTSGIFEIEKDFDIRIAFEYYE